MLDPAIKSFLKERKEYHIKAKTKAKMSAEEKAEIVRKATKTFALHTWLPFEAGRAKQIAITTHPAKFTYPLIKKDQISFTVTNTKRRPDGFIRTGNAPAEEDGFGGAAGLTAYKFLTIKLKDGKTVLQHLEEESPEIQEQLKIPGHSFLEIREKFLAIKPLNNQVDITHERVKQVYFPVDNDYHLLSILTPSGLIFKLKERVNAIRFSKQAKQAREAKLKNELDEEGFSDLYNLSVIGFGGTKPQNISVLNSQNFGRSYLLQSMPPTLQKRTIQPPKNNFFINTINPWKYKDSFQTFHNLIYMVDNNVNIREGRDKVIQFIISQVIERMWMIRQLESGWSEGEAFISLPTYQKLWLDNCYTQEREDNDDWIIKITEDLARWFLVAYEKVIGKKLRNMRAVQLPHIKKIINDNVEGLR